MSGWTLLWNGLGKGGQCVVRVLRSHWFDRVQQWHNGLPIGLRGIEVPFDGVGNVFGNFGAFDPRCLQVIFQMEGKICGQNQRVGAAVGAAGAQ